VPTTTREIIVPANLLRGLVDLGLALLPPAPALAERTSVQEVPCELQPIKSRADVKQPAAIMTSGIVPRARCTSHAPTTMAGVQLRSMPASTLSTPRMSSTSAIPASRSWSV
jgi:hypothetical protein